MFLLIFLSNCNNTFGIDDVFKQQYYYFDTNGIQDKNTHEENSFGQNLG